MARSDKTVVLFTYSFPYDKVQEQSFLVDELKHLQASFARLILVPQSIKGDKYELPAGIEVNETLSEALRTIGFKHKIKTVLSPLFIRELFRTKFDRTKLRYAISYALSAQVTREWVKTFVKDKETKKLILYSFWANSVTLGFVRAKRDFPELRIVSRCHNFDLYGNRFNKYYVPYFNAMFSNLDRVYPDSHFGLDYIREKLPKAKVESGIMGVHDPGFVTQESSDGVFRIVSCSYVIKRKRVDLIAKGLADVCRKNPDLKIEWYHIGGGRYFDDLKKLATECLPVNCTANFLGSVSVEQMMHLYKETPLDLFMNTSIKEGTPVALIQAISCGIPVLVTAFGGNKEIAEKGAGKLLSESPSEVEVGEKILEMVNLQDRKALRLASKAVWDKYYNSESNYVDFCAKLDAI